MSEKTEFTGLTMPVFTAFGWAGQENAIKYALSQLEQFIQQLHANLPHSARVDFPHYGLSVENRTVYLAAEADTEKDMHITFNARPMSFEILVAVTDKEVLSRTWKLLLRNLSNTMSLINKLDPSWTLRVQQMQLVEGSDEPIHYQDLYRDTAKKLDDVAAQEMFEKADYLNGEEKWITPIYLSQRIPSEQIAAMGRGVTQVLSERLAAMMPLITMLGGRVAGQRPRPKPAKPTKQTAVSPTEAPTAMPRPVVRVEMETAVTVGPQELFTFSTVLKPLHIRRGFINLTPEHWLFFAEGARSETRSVILKFGSQVDKESTVWRLQPSDMARIVLSPSAHQWLEKTFDAEDTIYIRATESVSRQITVDLIKDNK
ncbi:MAG: hypothetical protein KC423_23690 [Anaerolineales bacterium]|nr:hypothetical protein [Anaerolineales bacterium]